MQCRLSKAHPQSTARHPPILSTRPQARKQQSRPQWANRNTRPPPPSNPAAGSELCWWGATTGKLCFYSRQAFIVAQIRLTNQSPWAGACRGAPFALNGCINDALCLRHLVKTRFGFRDEDIMLLTDDQPNPDRWPTRANMLYQMQMLVWDLRPGDSLFFSFSGMSQSLLHCSVCQAFLVAANPGQKLRALCITCTCPHANPIHAAARVQLLKWTVPWFQGWPLSLAGHGQRHRRRKIAKLYFQPPLFRPPRIGQPPSKAKPVQAGTQGCIQQLLHSITPSKIIDGAKFLQGTSAAPAAHGKWQSCLKLPR